MNELIDSEIEKMLDLGIIEKSENGSEWVSNLITVPKKNKEVRVCIDMREPNKAIIRDPHPSPRVEDISAKLEGAKVFAKLDVKKAFWQIDLHPDSKYLTFFITTKGTYHYNRVPFGMASSSDIFQKVMEEIFQNIEGLVIECDDMIMFAENDDKLIETIEQVFERCRERHVVLNPKKVKLGLREIDVVGHNFTDKGVKPSKSKVSAIIDAPAPTNVNELRSFLGTVGYVHKFILDYARICEPLRKLLRNDVEWKWESAQENAFSELKNEISKHPCLAYYKLGAPTTVIVDGSPVGVGAVLLQKQGDNSLKPVAYASRSLTATERRYSQVEREALACVWAVEYFRNYLWGVNFQILTDHRPLIYMFNPKVSTIVPPRIQRLLWKLQAYDYTIEHIPGKENIADSLSRMPVQTIHDERHDSFVDDYILNIIDICFNSDDILSENAITLDELKLETTNDETLCKLHGYICAEWPKVLEPEIQPFYKYRNELSTFDSLILRGHRIVVPSVLKDRVLNLAHETHPGIVRTKVFLRMRYFWPGLDSEVEQVVLNCKECTINQPLVHDTPLQPVELPDKPWQKLAIDVFGPIKGDYLLTVMDYHSSWPEAIILPDIRSESIILGLADIFSRFGFPEEVVSDNAQSFVSDKTVGFFKSCGIKHIRCSPYYPRSNGKIERFHRYLKKTLKCAVKSGHKSWKFELCKILMSYRSTPHRASNLSPAYLLLKHEIRTKLPMIDLPANVKPPHKLHNEKYSDKMKLYADKKGMLSVMIYR